MALSNQLIKGILKTITLKVINDHEKIHGYEIIKIVKQVTSDAIQITEGAIYPTLIALEAEDYLNSEIEYFGKKVRRHYQINAKGKELLKQNLTEIELFSGSLNLLLFK